MLKSSAVFGSRASWPDMMVGAPVADMPAYYQFTIVAMSLRRIAASPRLIGPTPSCSWRALSLPAQPGCLPHEAQRSQTAPVRTLKHSQSSRPSQLRGKLLARKCFMHTSHLRGRDQHFIR